MAAPEEEEVQAFTFPPPPYWFKLYGQQAEGAPPPAPPAPRLGSFQVFDRILNTDEPLVATTPNQMIVRRPDGSIDIRGQLLSLTCELLPLFLELVRQLVNNPSSHTGQLAAVSDALEAMQHLSNLLRPQQAAATLEYALQLDVQELQDTLSKLHAQVEGVDKLLAEAESELDRAKGGGGVVKSELGGALQQGETGAVKQEHDQHDQEKQGGLDVQMAEAGGAPGVGALGADADESRQQPVKEEVI